MCPDCEDLLRAGINDQQSHSQEAIRQAEWKLLDSSCPWNLGMAKSPEIWDAMPWSYWDPSIIYDNVELNDKIVLDVGAGTGQVTIRCAPYASLVYAMEPVAKLRRYIERKLGATGFNNVRTKFGLMESIPMPDNSVDAAILSNGSFGWNPKKELAELERVTRTGGKILMRGPCNFVDESIISEIQAIGGYKQSEIIIPGDGTKPVFIKEIP